MVGRRVHDPGAASMADHRSTAGSVVVLMYHRVGDAHNDWERKYCVAPRRFEAQMNALRRAGHCAIAIDDFVAWLEGAATLPSASIVITFDDGFQGVREHALPVLERLGWPFVVFLVSDLIGENDVWTHAQNPSGATYPLLGVREIIDMQQRGVSFQSHTRSHASLTKLDDAALVDELEGSRKRLAEMLGRDVAFLAYPYGHVDDRVRAATRAAGYRAAFSTRPGFNRRDVDRHAIRRIDIFGTDTPAMLLRKVRMGCNDGRLGSAVRYYAGRAARYLPGAAA